MKEDKFTIYIIPHQEGKSFRFSVRKRVLKDILLGLISLWVIGILSTLTLLPLYLSERHLRQESWQTLKKVQSHNRQLNNLLMSVKEESEVIKNYLTYLGQIEEEVRESLKLGPTKVSLDDLLAGRDSNIWSVSRNANDEFLSISESLTQLNLDARSTAETLTALQEATDIFKELKQKTPDIYPVLGPIVSYFGWRRHPVWKGRDFHRGIDILASYGTGIRVSADGKVTEVGYSGSLGKTVTVYHRDGISTLYAHLSKAIVKKGQEVTKGQIIGYVGTSGITTGSHLHYEVRYKGASIDPLPYLP